MLVIFHDLMIIRDGMYFSQQTQENWFQVLTISRNYTICLPTYIHSLMTTVTLRKFMVDSKAKFYDDFVEKIFFL